MMNAKTALVPAILWGLGLAAVPQASLAQVPGQSQLPGAPAPANPQRNAPINAANDVSLDQKLNTQISLNNLFRDENGKTVPLSNYFGGKPVVLVLPFYKCPGVCTAELDGIVKTLQDERLKFKVGRDFEILTVSINPKEGSDLATMKKKEYLNQLSQPGAGEGWHFLTGTQESIKKLAGEVGFKYVYDAKTDQYAHPAGLILLTDGGKVSKYFYGVEYSPLNMRLGLTDAGQGKVGTAVDKFVLYCYHYDPAKGTYGPAIFRIIQVAGFTTVFLLGSFMLMAFRKDHRDSKGMGASTKPGVPPVTSTKA
ncbi:MAG: SCO family protein [Cytophagales bacterium]|nr:SCO family protein [Armatimonadota bacterium]